MVVSRDTQNVLSWLKKKENILYVEDNPEEDTVLLSVGIERASGLVSVLNDDRDNLYVVLSARELNHRIRIVTQAIDRSAVPKLIKAGADEVVSSTVIGGMRIASTMLRPAVVKFLDAMLYGKDKPLRFE